MNEKGICEKHGEFTLAEGCPGCLAERRKTGIAPAQDELEDGLNQEGLTLAGTEELDRMVNLCDTCTLRMEYPVCSPRDVVFGDGHGHDNIIKCANYHNEEPSPFADALLKGKVEPGPFAKSLLPQKQESKTAIVKVKYFSETTGELSPREYTYYSTDPLEVGDIVSVPVRGTFTKAKVSAIGVPESQIEAYKDNVKTIPAGAKMEPRAEPPAAAEPQLVLAEKQGEPLTITDELLEETATAETAIVRIAPDKDEGYIKLLAETTKLLDYSTKLVIKGVDDKKAATNDLIIMGDLGKEIEAVKKEWLGPIDEHRKSVFDMFKQLADPLAQAVKQTKTAMIEYDREQERIRLELEEIARKERELEEDKARAENREPVEVKTVAVPEQDTGRTRSELGLASTVTTYKANVVDFKLLSDDYKMPDMAKLNRVVNAAKGKIEIPGVKIETEYNLRTNRRTG